MWLIFFPFAIGGVRNHVAVGEEVVVGVVLIGTSLWSAVTAPRPSRAATWLLLACGVWLPIAPFVLGYYHDIAAQNEMLNDFLVGLTVVLIAGVRIMWVRRLSDRAA
jgi:hypothetical protein